MSGTRRVSTGLGGRGIASLSLAAWLAMGCGLARGQSQAQPPSTPPLQGPKVTTDRPPELEDEFAPGKREKGEARQQFIPLQAYMTAVNKLRGEDAPKDLRLSSDQEKKIDTIVDDFHRAQREYARKALEESGDQNTDEMAPAEIAAPVRKRPGAGGEDGAPMRQRVEEMRRNGPRPSEPETKIWNVLASNQQTFVKGELDKVKADLEKRRAEEYMRRQIEQRKGGKGKDGAAAVQPVAGAPPGPTPEMRERMQRIFEKMRQLSPEEREQVLQKLEQDLDQRSGGADAPNTTPAPKGGKPGKAGRERPGDESTPAPSMDDVKVPKPSDK